MKDVGQRWAEVAALKHAVPYIRMFKGKIFVLKVGGALFAEPEAIERLIGQVEILHQVGIRTVLVHGGGPQSTELAAALGAEARFVAGRRVTDPPALEVAIMVLNGSVNTRILAACRSVGLPAVGLSGIDAGLVRARRRPPVTVDGDEVDYGLVGDVVGVDTGILATLLGAGVLPVVSPLSCDQAGTVLNVNADTVASALAVGLRAEKLIVLTGAPGVLEDPRDPASLVSYTDLAGLERLRRAGALETGMLPKASAVEAALRGGVRRVHLVSHAVPDSILLEVFTNEGIGTLVVEDLGTLLPAEQVAAETAGAPAGPEGAS